MNEQDNDKKKAGEPIIGEQASLSTGQVQPLKKLPGLGACSSNDYYKARFIKV
ncbi:MAG: hypothetical protein V4568_14440 [Pseudomonadota bacterium]